MTKIIKLLILIILLIVLGFMSLVFVWDIPAPTKRLEKNVTSDSFNNDE